MAPYRPALIVVDFQEDFCPPNGTLAVPHGRDIAPTINHLLNLPFTLRIATQDWHPPSHISFASAHPPPNNTPFTSTHLTHNPLQPSESQSITLWPDHCVQDSPGAALVPELHMDRIEHVVRKGMDGRVEMFSAFRDSFEGPRVCESGLGALLEGEGVSHVFVVGLAAEYCVKWTALHACADGYETVVVAEGTRAVGQAEEVWEGLVRELEGKGVRVVSVEGDEVRRVRDSV